MNTQAQHQPAPRAFRPLQALRSLTLDHLWLLSVVALIWFFLGITPMPPNDLWWHMAAGRTMAEEGSLITTNRWAYTLPADAPYVYQSWLSELVMYGLWWLGDVPMLALGRMLAITLSYALLAWHALRRVEGQARAVALALLLAALLGFTNWTLRPQTLALLPAAVFVVVLGEYTAGRARARWLILLPLVMALWVNIHGSFALGAVLLALTWLGEALRLLRGGAGLRGTWHTLLPLTGAGIATALALLANPLGLGIVGYVQNMLTNTPLQAWFVEWQPSTNETEFLNAGFRFYLVLLLLVALMSAGPRRPSATDLLWFCALAWLAISGVRYVMWFGLLLLPLLAEQIASVLRTRPATRSYPPFVLGYAGLLLLLVLAVLPWFGPGRLVSNEALVAQGGPHSSLLGRTTPIQATAWLADNPIEGRFWTNMTYSSYTIWELPDKQVFADLRVELFPVPIWEDYFDIARGNEDSLALIDEWQITHLLLANEGDLAVLLHETPGWCEAYRDERAAVLVRCPAGP